LKSQFAIVKCKEYNPELVYNKIKEAINYLGGISEFIKPNELVLLKPNLLIGKSPKLCVNTHPTVVEAVAKLVLETGAKVILGDSPGFGSTRTNARNAGYKEIAEKLGFEIVEFNTPIKYNHPQGKLYKYFEIDENIKKVDKIINLPKLKTHGMMYLTLAVKNLFGAIVGTNKLQWHFIAGKDYNRFSRFLVELYYFINPTLNILDAIIGMEGNGPQSGNPKQIGLIIASKDGLSLDRIACEIVGLNPDDIPIFSSAKELGFNTQELENIEILGEKIEDVQITNFKPPRRASFNALNLPKTISKIIDKYLTSHPKINNQICTRCKICAQICPTKAITSQKHKKQIGQYSEYMNINYDKCIRCFCCQEMCPSKAINIKESFFLNILTKITHTF